MFKIKELQFLNSLLKDSESQDEMTLSLIERIDESLISAKGYNKCLWKFHWDCGRQGSVNGLFKATKEEVENAIGNEVRFGEILGKHSEVEGILGREDLELLSDDPIEVMNSLETGYDPLEYVCYRCKECGCSYHLDEFNIEKQLCNDCFVNKI